MDLLHSLTLAIKAALKACYDLEVDDKQIQLSPTRKEFEGQYTVVVFPFTKAAKKGPEQIGNDLGAFLAANEELVADFNVIKGFLNLSIQETYWLDFLNQNLNNADFGTKAKNGESVMVEFSSPNTNKPLHLGHIRNILLGWSVSQILKTVGYDVVKTQIVNDRGIHICKSMVAWLKEGNGETPTSAKMKGDHFVGKYYVIYNNLEKAQKATLEDEKADAPILLEARELLQKWEANDPEVRALWEKMNGWVYSGFDTTYDTLGVSFDKLYYESDTYLLGKSSIEKGLLDKVFYTKEDGSVWIDLENAKMDHKLVLRSDGTSVYMTQDIGTAQVRFNDFKMNKMVYVVGDEQNYHFKVLFEIMKRLGAPYASGLFHLSYGMVDLPTGRMKSREGTVVDADDLVADVINEVREAAKERQEIEVENQDEIFRKIGLGALKYFMLKINPQKRMVFDPKESVDLQGNTGPYIQNAYVRIQSILRKAADVNYDSVDVSVALEPLEKELIVQLFQFPGVLESAAKLYDPSILANYCFELAKNYHRFYHDHQILKLEDEKVKQLRLALSKMVGDTLAKGMGLLGIEMPEKM